MNSIELKKTARSLVEGYASEQLNEGFKPQGLHIWEDQNGNLLYIRIRLKHPDGRKWIRPFHYNSEKQKWIMGEPKFENGKPLYHLSNLAKYPDAEVWIPEGENKVEALEKYGLVATTSGGANTALETNWEILRNRNVVLLRDNDTPGINYQDSVIKILRPLNCNIRIVDIDKLNLNDGEDIIDYIKVNPGITQSDILSLPMIDDASNTKSILDDLKNIIDQLIVLPTEHESIAIALFVLHTYCIDSAHCTPILNITSPEKRCGKTTLLSVLGKLVNNPLIASNISPAAIFRSIEKWSPTLIIDEADTFFLKNEEIRGVINSGHTRDTAYVIRCIGKDHETKQFNTWCPKIIAGIGDLPETVMDRSIVIQLQRKLNTQQKRRLRNIPNSIFEELRQRCANFATENAAQLKILDIDIPESLNDRAGDNWAPLFAIAELVSKTWLKRAKDAAIQLSGNTQEVMSIRAELLLHIKNIFDSRNVNRLHTKDLINELCSDIESPWATYNREKPITANQLAKLLKEFKIHSKDMRIPPCNKNLKGYALDDFSDAFKRYIPPEISATTRQLNNHAVYHENEAHDKIEMSREAISINPMTQGRCSAVADKSSDLGVQFLDIDRNDIDLFPNEFN